MTDDSGKQISDNVPPSVINHLSSYLTTHSVPWTCCGNWAFAVLQRKKVLKGIQAVIDYCNEFEAAAMTSLRN
jgi:hypothetical protein